MGRTTGRTPEDTKRALLDAAASAVRARGIHASLDEIARHAGVSKGGLMYHYATKDELILALVADHLAAFRTSIQAHLDADDLAPGRFTRAYIRACLAPADDMASVREAIMLIGQLMTIPAVADVVRADWEDLYQNLNDDGLPEPILTLVLAAADGVSTAPIWGLDTREPRYEELEGRLLNLTLHPELWDVVA